MCSWLLYLLALIFLGGVIVVLLFIVSICANDKFIFNKSSMLGVAGLLAFSRRVLTNPTVRFKANFSNYFIGLSLYQSDCGMLFALFIGYLVVCLVSVVSIRKLEAGPLVKRL